MRQTLISWVATSSFLILAVIALRAALGKRMGAGLRYALWGLVLVRLLAPVQLFSSPFVGTVINRETIVTRETVTEREALEAIGGQDGPQVAATAAPVPPSPPDFPEAPEAPDWAELPTVLGWLWLAGGAAMALVLLGCNLNFYLRLRRARQLLEGADCSVNVYTAPGLPSPCLFGVFRPAIYVAPETAADPVALRHVLAHEGTHASHGDHIWSLLRCAALCVHWWNPLVWLAAKLSRRDGELACDEGALKRLGDGERTAYGSTLLALVTTKATPGNLLTCSTAMNGDKKSLKERFARIARAPKRAVGIAVAAVVLASLVTVCAFGQKTEAYREENGDTPQPDEPLRYSGVTSVTGEFDYPPFTTFTLTGREANELLDCLSVLELPDSETTGLPDGDGVTYTIETPDGSYSFGALKPWLLYDGSAYLLGMDSELFRVTDRIAAGHGGTAGHITDGDTPVPVETPAPSESPAPTESEDPMASHSAGLTAASAEDPADMTELPYHPDLNRNGVPETLLAGEYHRWDDPSGESTLEGVGVWEDGELLWTSTETDSPGSGNAYLLVDLDDGNYLMEYSVWSENGRYASTYLGYDLKPLGQQMIFNGDTHFICSSGEEVAQTFSAEDTADFLDNINRLLSRSTVILDREGVFADRDTPCISLSWLEKYAAGFTWDDSATNLENLTRFKELSLNPPQSAPVTDTAGARAELKAALLGETDFVLYDENGPHPADISTAPPRAFESLSAEWEKYNSFAVADLDGDGVEEVVYHVTDVAGDMGGHLILHWAGPGDVRCYPKSLHTTQELKADGSFDFAYLGVYGSAWLSFPESKLFFQEEPFLTSTMDLETGEEGFFLGDEAVTREEFDAAWEEQHEKPDAVWYDFTPENVKKALG